MIKIHTDIQGVEESINQLKAELNLFKECLEAIKIITGKDGLISLTELNEAILKGTTFTDVQKVADLKSVGSAYAFYKDNYNKFNIENYTENLEIKAEVLEAIEIEHTRYLDKEAEAIFRKLDKCTEILNSINRAYSDSLTADYNGIWSINLLNLQTIYNEIKRSENRR